MDAGATRHTQTDRRDARERGTSEEKRADHGARSTWPAVAREETTGMGEIADTLRSLIRIWLKAARTERERDAMLFMLGRELV
jgi:hypothetical protein